MKKTSTKTTKKTATKTITPANRWEDLEGTSETGEILLKRMPVKRIATPCTVGMVVGSNHGGSCEGVVVAVTASHCIVQFENGGCDAYPWHTVCISCVEPAGMKLAHPVDETM